MTNSSLKKIEISEQLLSNIDTNVFNKPPIPSNKFHNRGSGKLFQSTCNNRLFTEEGLLQRSQNDDLLKVEKCKNSIKILHPTTPKSCRTKNDSETKEPGTPKSMPDFHRRTQSAKARLQKKVNAESNLSQQRPLSAASLSTNNEYHITKHNSDKKVRIIDLSERVISDLFQIEKEKLVAKHDQRECSNTAGNDVLPMHFTKTSPKFEFAPEQCTCKTESVPSSVDKALKPSVFGLQKHRHFYGSAPDLSRSTNHYQCYPYKISDDNGDVDSDTKINDNITDRSIPSTLKPLLPWLKRNVPEDVIGINPADCLVFLAATDWYELPEVPSDLQVEEDLPYITNVTTPKPWNPKKYSYFKSKQLVEDWVCNHGACMAAGRETIDSHTFHRQTFKLPRMRTAEVVRKEISDLEGVLKGIGNMDSDNSLVQYQYEIHNFKHTLQTTLDMVPERLKNPALPTDTFGLKKVFSEHDTAIQEIKARLTECCKELAELEIEAGINTPHQHFRNRSNSIF